MAHKLVKIISDDDGDITNDESWHLVEIAGGSETAFCTGEVFGQGEGMAVFDTKQVQRGGITCQRCLARIRDIKAIRL